MPFTSPYSIIILIILYLSFVLKFGPQFMEKREPYNIERILMAYNLLQVVSNLALVVYVRHFFFSEAFLFLYSCGIHEKMCWFSSI